MMRRISLLVLMATSVLLAGCGSGMVRRVSDPAVSVQQLTVKADGQWVVELRLQNYSSIPMRFETASLKLSVGEHDAGTLLGQANISIGPESADVVTLAHAPATGAKLALADALANGRGIGYHLEGTLQATPEDGRSRSFDIERDSALSPVPGLTGVLR